MVTEKIVIRAQSPFSESCTDPPTFALTRKFPVVYHELLNEKLIKHITDEMGKLMGDESTRGKVLS